MVTNGRRIRTQLTAKILVLFGYRKYTLSLLLLSLHVAELELVVNLELLVDLRPAVERFKDFIVALLKLLLHFGQQGS